MKAVLMSIRPQWCELIASGKKTVEVRKSTPKLELPFKCYIYCTRPKVWFKYSSFGRASEESLWLANGKVEMCDGFKFWSDGGEYTNLNGKVIGEFVCDGFDEFTPTEKGVSFKRFSALHDSCLSLAEIRNYLANRNGYGWHISQLKIYDKPKELGELYKPDYPTDFWPKDISIKKPPQNWCYVEELPKGE